MAANAHLGGIMQRRAVNLPDTPGATRLPISSAIVARDFVFTAGHVGWVPETREAPAGIEAQTAQTLENLKAVLEAAGTSLEHVVKFDLEGCAEVLFADTVARDEFASDL